MWEVLMGAIVFFLGVCTGYGLSGRVEDD